MIRGQKFVIRGQKFVIRGQKFVIRGQKFVIRGQKFVIRGQKFVIRGQKFVIRGQKFVIRGQKLVVRGLAGMRGLRPGREFWPGFVVKVRVSRPKIGSGSSRVGEGIYLRRRVCVWFKAKPQGQIFKGKCCAGVWGDG